jgi:hypothetical protein
MVEFATNVTSGDRVGPSIGAFEIKFRSLSNRFGSGTSSCGLGTISVGTSRLFCSGGNDDVIDDIDEFATESLMSSLNSGGSFLGLTLLLVNGGEA